MSNLQARPSSRNLLKKALIALSVFAVLFGVLTIISGGLVLFGPIDRKARAGQIVPWVLWFNFLAGFAYIIAGIGILRGHKWALGLTAIIAMASLLVLAFLGFHIFTGGAYELRTLAAMPFRAAVWTILAIMLYVSR